LQKVKPSKSKGQSSVLPKKVGVIVNFKNKKLRTKVKVAEAEIPERKLPFLFFSLLCELNNFFYHQPLLY